MGKAYLLDTNTVIYFLDGALPQYALDFVTERLNEDGSFISVITKIELLGWQAGSAKKLQDVKNFVEDSDVISLTDAVVDKTVEIKRTSKIKLPDAVIAATAIVHDFTLISRNDDDFRKVPGLKYINPFSDI